MSTSEDAFDLSPCQERRQAATEKQLSVRHYQGSGSVPEWAYYKVLGYKFSRNALIRIAMYQFKQQGEDAETLAELKNQMEQGKWNDTGIIFWALGKYLSSPTYLDYNMYTQTVGAKPGFILAFCSSTRLPEDTDGTFCAQYVRPETKMAQLKRLSCRLGVSGLTPMWWIPDQALKFGAMMEGEIAAPPHLSRFSPKYISKLRNPRPLRSLDSSPNSSLGSPPPPSPSSSATSSESGAS